VFELLNLQQRQLIENENSSVYPKNNFKTDSNMKIIEKEKEIKNI
jgi:hypothetical protein